MNKEIWCIEHNWRVTHNMYGYLEEFVDTYTVGQDDVESIIVVDIGHENCYFVNFKNGGIVALYNVNKVYYHESTKGMTVH